VLSPVIHYLVEAVRSCSLIWGLPPGALLIAVLGLAVTFLVSGLSRARARR
jgi:hypothetical protein